MKSTYRIEIRARISRGNTKLGKLANISLTPIRTCPTCPCWEHCYALKSQRMYAATRACRAANVQAYLTDPEAYFASVMEQTEGLDFFRWHVAGDCIDLAYCYGMLNVAYAIPFTDYLIFTKRYAWWNALIWDVGKLPANLSVVYSAWPGFPMDNPHNMPVAFMVPKEGEEERLDGTEIACPGNCETCGMCWSLATLGRNVAFHQH